jgi:hypothetical protein
MTQALLNLGSFDTATAAPAPLTGPRAGAPATAAHTAHGAGGPGTARDSVAFDIGWDHAHHGLVPPPALLNTNGAIVQGWMAGKAVYGRRTLPCRRSTRQWLALRLQAWHEGTPFEGELVTANYLGQLHTECCPVRRKPLGGPGGAPDAAVVQRLDGQGAYAAGRLVVMSQLAAQALQSHTVPAAVRQARMLEAADRPLRTGAAALRSASPATGPQAPATAGGLDAGGWWRVAALRSFATPLPFHEAARLPLAVLPPNRVRLLNAVQGLQALVTAMFQAPGWSARCRALGAMLPAHTLRHDFNLFVGAMAPRVLEAGGEPATVARALEDAWLQDRVQRRWQHWVLSLGESGVEHLLERVAAAGLAARRTLLHPAQAAAEVSTLVPCIRAPQAAAALTAMPEPASAGAAVPMPVMPQPDTTSALPGASLHRSGIRPVGQRWHKARGPVLSAAPHAARLAT